MVCEPLKVGVAGVGTVGAALISQIAAQREALTARCGRPIEVVAVMRALQGQEARHRSAQDEMARRSGLAGARPGHRRLCRADGRRGRSGQGRGRGGAGVRQVGRHCEQGAACAQHGVALARVAEENHVALNFEAAVGGAIPIVKTLREGLAGNSLDARLRHPQRHLQLHPDADGSRRSCRFEECLKDAQRLGYAEADPTFDIEGHDTAQKLAILASLAFGTKVDRKRGLRRRDFLDHAGRSGGGRRAWLSRQAARRCDEDRKGHRAARASDHGARRNPRLPG